MTARVIHASAAGARLDTDLRHGGGTDDTAALQSVLDLAADGTPLHLILDGPARVTGLRVFGSTTIEGREGAGFFLAAEGAGAILRNAHPSRTEIVDRGITIRGCAFSGNRATRRDPSRPGWPQAEPDGTFKATLQFHGVRELTIENSTVWGPRAFGIWLSNVEDVRISDVEVDVDMPRYPEGASPAEQRVFLESFRSTLDGIHVNGPASRVLMEGLRIRSEDDGIALNANDAGVDDMTRDAGAYGGIDPFGPFVGQGPITDVVVRDVTFDDTLQAIRVLSTTERVDRVLVEGVRGTVRHRMALVGNFLGPSPGDVGTVEFRDVHIEPMPSATWRQMGSAFYDSPVAELWDIDEEGELPLFAVNAVVEELSIRATVTPIDERPLLRLGARAALGRLDARIEVRGARAPVVAWHPAATVGDLHLEIGARATSADS